ncbi:BTAD domain-containing putative transcriptional regulator [Pelagibius sp. Alg239-R121]|uniref:BTAD domain-containing putative transcriptional regulator n=1 Tax=Pelagibius sp. Alg239-R121 TaxID=2993448 RepID=UPI0024A6CFE7|nr:BTAD domain-containing putative transcriptional regulator [Pelagibius sp. Alg239-R121]
MKQSADHRDRSANPGHAWAASDPAPVEILLFGSLQVWSQGASIQLKGVKDGAFLSALAAAPGLSLSRDSLAGMLWENSSERHARDSLKQTLLKTRRLLDPTGMDVICADRDAIWFNAGQVRVDVAEFTGMLADSSLRSVDTAIGLRRGPFLEGQAPVGQEYDGWLFAERTRLDRLYLDAAMGIMRQAELAGRTERALEVAKRVLSVDTENETAARCLMRLLSQHGERRAALRFYDSLRERLNDEFAIQPQQATVDLYNAIRKPYNRRKTELPAIVEPGPVPAKAPNPQEISIAVLPFANLGPDLVDDFFIDGLTEDIVTDLSGAVGISVASRHTTLAMKEHAIGAVQAARHFAVSHVLEGSVRRENNCLRVTVRLIDGHSGHQIWAQRYDRGDEGVFALQDELSRDVAEILKVKLSAERRGDGSLSGTRCLEAYEAYHKGRAFYLRGMNSFSLRVSRMLLTRAIELDPGYALAYAQLAICESYLAMSLINTNAESCFEACMEHSRKALKLDPFLAEAHAGKGLAHYAAGQYTEAGIDLDAAIRLDDSLFEAHFFQARNKHLLGQRDEAAWLFERSAALRPNDFRAVGLLAEEYLALGCGDKARFAFGRCLMRLKAEVEIHPDNAGALAFGSAVLAHLGHTKQAIDWANWALAIGPEDCLIHYNSARTWMILSRPEDALTALEAAFSMPIVVRKRLAMWMAFDKDLEPLAGNPRFERLLACRSDPQA